MTPYHEPRTFTPAFAAVLVLTAAGAVWVLATGERVSLRNDLIAAGVGLSLLLFFFWFGTSRWGSEFKTITIDERGLTVGPLSLPPDAIGRTWVIGRDLAQRRTARGRFQDGGTTFKVTYSTFGFLGTTDDVLVVEDTSAERPSVWFVASRDPHAAEEALATLPRSRGLPT